MTIRKVEAPARSHKFAVYDLEWYPNALWVRVVGFFDGETYQYFKTVDEFLRFILTREYRQIWLFAHAGGTFDFTFFLNYFYKHKEFEVESNFSGSSAVLIKVKRGKDVWTFVDSFFLLRTSLEKIAEKMGMKKGGVDKETRKKLFYTENFQELVDYNEQDVRILYKALDNFFQFVEQLGGEMMPTIASTAMRLFRRKYLQENIRTSKEWNGKLRQAYHASRVEPFVKEAENVNYYDFNSSFPWSMTQPTPGQKIGKNRKIPSGGNLFAAKIDFSIPKDCYFPPMPYRHSGKTYFPTGTWPEPVWVSGVDVRAISEVGKIHKVHEVVHFDERYDLRAYVEDIYARRKVSVNDYDREIMKLLLNSLYGKFGERTEKTSIYMNAKNYHELKSKPGAEELMPGVILFSEEREIAHEHVPMAMNITADSRQLLGRALVQVGDARYCDTDSLFTAKELPSSMELGCLKLVGHVEKARFFAAKFYELDGEVKSKGFPKLTAEDFAVLIGGGSQKVERMTRIKEMWRKEITKPQNMVIWKSLRFGNDKRRFAPDGRSSQPYDISDLPSLEANRKRELKGEYTDLMRQAMDRETRWAEDPALCG